VEQFLILSKFSLFYGQLVLHVLGCVHFGGIFLVFFFGPDSSLNLMVHCGVRFDTFCLVRFYTLFA